MQQDSKIARIRLRVSLVSSSVPSTGAKSSPGGGGSQTLTKGWENGTINHGLHFCKGPTIKTVNKIFVFGTPSLISRNK